MTLKQRARERLNRKYSLEERGTMCVSAVPKQKIRAGGIKTKRYDERCQKFKQKQTFRTNKKLFQETLNGKGRDETELPEPAEATTFWREIWKEEVSQNDKASQLEEFEQEFSVTETQEDITINLWRLLVME